MKSNLLSGIQPSGQLHLGNYLGALKNFVALQNGDQYQCYFFVADLHSLTEGFAPVQQKQQVLDLLASYLAIGLNPKKSTLFIQSHIPAHAELAWLLNTITPFGELSRMTQFKDKSERQHDNINVGLFTYPVLQAADILLYDAQFVPVGDDQVQHLELTRTLARKFNSRFGETFIEPQPLLTPTPRVMSLQEPTKKMSKSQPSGCLFLDDMPEDIQAKIMSAVTDSDTRIKFDSENKPGISNLLTIYANLTDTPVATAEQQFAGTSYAPFKKSLVKVITKHFASFRRKKEKLLLQPEKLLRIAHRGAKRARPIAEKKVLLAKEKMGI